MENFGEIVCLRGRAEGRGQREESVVANKVGGVLRKLTSNEGGRGS